MSFPSEEFCYDRTSSHQLPTGFDIWVELINRTLITYGNYNAKTEQAGRVSQAIYITIPSCRSLQDLQEPLWIQSKDIKVSSNDFPFSISFMEVFHPALRKVK